MADQYIPHESKGRLLLDDDDAWEALNAILSLEG